MTSYKDDVLEVSFLNWGKYNPKSGAKNVSWVRLDCELINNEAVQRLCTSGFKALITLCLKSAKNCGSSAVPLFTLRRDCNFRSREMLIISLEIMQNAEILEYKIVNKTVKAGKLIAKTNERTNGTNGTNETNVGQGGAKITSEQANQN